MVAHKVLPEVRRDVFHSIADPTRRAILLLLAMQAMTPNALAAHFDSSRQAVSKHIKILCESQLLKQEKAGREIYYQLNPKKLQEINQWLNQFRQLMEKRFVQLDDLLGQQKKTRKK